MVILNTTSDVSAYLSARTSSKTQTEDSMVNHNSITCCKTAEGRRLCAMQAHLLKVIDEIHEVPEETLSVIGDTLEMEYVYAIQGIRSLHRSICERRDAIEAESEMAKVAA